MSGHTTLKRDGAWQIDLIQPVHDGNKTIDSITIRPAQLNDMISWGQKIITTTLGMLSLMSGVPESALRNLKYPDVNRVMQGLFEVLPKEMRDVVFGAPMTTPLDQMTPEQQYADISADLDPQDPRFPRAEGHVWRMPQKEKAADIQAETHNEKHTEEAEGSGFAAAPPDILKVG